MKDKAYYLKLYQEYKRIWQESGAWRKVSFEEFIKGIVEVMSQINEPKQTNKTKSKRAVGPRSIYA